VYFCSFPKVNLTGQLIILFLKVPPKPILSSAQSGSIKQSNPISKASFSVRSDFVAPESIKKVTIRPLWYFGTPQNKQEEAVGY
jgi:hypothetical protein